MLVVSIIKKGNNVQILFDDNSKLLLNYNVFIDSMLRKNDDVDQKFIDEIKRKNELYKIKYSALNFLGRRSHSKRELYQKLTKKGFEKFLIMNVLDQLTEINYINDRDFAEKYAEEKIKKGRTGINKIKTELFNKGVDRQIIEDIEHKYSSGENIVNNIIVLAKKKVENLKRKETDKYKLKSKLYSHLQGKGFTSEQITEAINTLDL